MGRRIGEKKGICWDLSIKLGIKWDLVGFGSWNWGENGIWWDLGHKLGRQMGFGGIWVVELGRKTGYRLQRNGIYWDFGSGDWGEMGSLGILAIN